MKNTKHVSDLIPAFVLGCLDNSETNQVLQHIASCNTCRKEVHQYLSIVGLIAETVPDVEPAQHVKSTIMNKINKLQTETAIDEGNKWKRFKSNFFAPVWPTVAAALILVLGVGNLLLWNQMKQLRKDAHLEDTHFIDLEGAEGAPLAHGYIYISDDGREGTLIAEELPELPKSEVYQVWLIRNGSRTSGGIFTVSDDGYGSLRIISSSPLNSYTSFGVSIEPTGGSNAPTGKKVLGGSL